MLGVTKAKLFPLVKAHLLNLKPCIVPLIVDLILTRTHELSAQEVKLLVKDVIYLHLSWIIFWGSVLGAIVGCAAELASFYIKGP
ncbi:uncharacterized protein LOC110048314 isoform X2 [Orbicella faveolata]|uniref:uncharacterized protein LOC110048314 isoform X2 n=1 Tax=Orbicella faveolata TaxID=48498 RepID=UPI0009E1F7AE|nr:uncharacterized protein LOC110048314 isoform X2 [Orbicella faveolata]